jgi:signal transduction histidine kinase
MLTAAKIESSTDVFHPEMLNLSKLVEECSTRLADNTGNPHRLLVDIQPGIEVKADAVAIEALVCNLLENALKYSPANSKVNLKLHTSEQYIWLSVSDSGPGIAASERPKIFNKFYRSGNEETRKSKGTGLGLYIVKQIAMQHQAEIKVDSNGEKGSIFTVRFNAKS